MLGNAEIVKILKEEYGIEDTTPFDEIEYEIEYFNDKLSKVKIISKSGRCFSCPVYATFDGYNMCWYGDYGFWGFNCTWETNVMNLAYNSPYYQLEKLRSRDRYEFNSDKCETELMKLIKESAWFNEDLNEEQKVRFIEFTSNSFDFIYSDDVLLEHEDICELLKKLILATRSESEWIYVLNNVEFENSGLSDIFECEYYELYELGKKVPGQYFIILYMLSVVANSEGCVKNYGKWIKASEELPKVSGEYLVKIADGKSATTLEYDEVTKEFWDEYSDCYSVEYWQPLPELPKEDGVSV